MIRKIAIVEKLQHPLKALWDALIESGFEVHPIWVREEGSAISPFNEKWINSTPNLIISNESNSIIEYIQNEVQPDLILLDHSSPISSVRTASFDTTIIYASLSDVYKFIGIGYQSCSSNLGFQFPHYFLKDDLIGEDFRRNRAKIQLIDMINNLS